MRLVVLDNGAMVADIVCGPEAAYIGSREGCAVHLPDSRLSPQQAVIYPESPEVWILQQLAPENELLLNGMTVTDKAALKSGDEIRLLHFVLRAYPAAEGPSAPPQPGMSVAQLARFVQSQLPAGAIVRRMDEQIVIQPAQLQRLGRVNVSLSQCLTPEQLMDLAIQAMHEIFMAARVWIGIRRVNYGSMEYVEGRLLTGQSCELPAHGENLKPRVLDRGQFILLPHVSAEERASVLAGPLAGPDGTLGMLYMDTGESGRRYEQADLDYFVVLSNTFAAQLDAIFKSLARARAATMEGEVIVAHEIQARLTPRKLPQWEQLQFGAFREPGRQRTGDIYDLVRLSNKHAALMVAYTRAGGAVPAMLMAQAHASFRTALMLQSAPHVYLRSMNWLLHDGRDDHPLDCFVAVIDPETGQMNYAVAGSVGAYIIDQRGSERRLGGDPTPSLGLQKAVAYPPLTEQLGSDESLVVFTPGVTTAKNGKGETFGEERFVNILCDGFGQLASNMLKEMLSDLRSFTEGGQQPDDITVVLAHRV